MQTITKTNKQIKNPTQITEKDRKKEWVKGTAKQLKQTNKQERAALSVYLSIIG